MPFASSSSIQNGLFSASQMLTQAGAPLATQRSMAASMSCVRRIGEVGCSRTT